MTDDALIEAVARALVTAAGGDPDALVSYGDPPLALGAFPIKLPDDSYWPLWEMKLKEARAAFVCIRDLRGLKDNPA